MINTNSNLSLDFQIVHRFLEGLDNSDSLFTALSYRLDCTVLDFIDQVAACVRTAIPNYPVSVQACAEGSYICSAGLETLGLKRLLIVIDTNLDAMPFKKAKRNLHLRIFGERNLVIQVHKHLNENITSENLAQIDWWYSSEGSYQTSEIIIDPPKPIYPEFYPWMDRPISDYFDDFLANDATVLLLTGQPGTGKTSFLRTFLHMKQLHAIVTYDEELLKSDNIFVSLLSSQANVLIIEDADLMITSRERDNNSLMSRFLNISDGLVKFPDKKIIFTTNITNVETVDEALLRPGRCYDVIEFRPLDWSETLAAARVAGITLPEERRSYTLAELFNPKKTKPAKFKMGIVA